MQSLPLLSQGSPLTRPPLLFLLLSQTSPERALFLPTSDKRKEEAPAYRRDLVVIRLRFAK